MGAVHKLREAATREMRAEASDASERRVEQSSLIVRESAAPAEDGTYDPVDDSRSFGRRLREVIVPDDHYVLDDSGAIQARDFGTVEITPMGDLYGRYEDLKAFLSECEVTGQRHTGPDGVSEATMEAHHLLPQKNLEQLGLSADACPSVGLWSGDHMGEIYANLVIGEDVSSLDDLRAYYSQAYAELGLPEWAQRVGHYLDENREAIEGHLAARTASAATETEVAEAWPDAAAASVTSAAAASGQAIEEAGTDVEE